MSPTTTRDAMRPRTSALDRSTAMEMAATEDDRFVDLLRSLSPDEWTMLTECPDWDVRAMATHVLGTAEMAASIRENRRQTRAAGRRGGLFIDALTALQVQERAMLGPEEIVARFARIAPKAGKGRRRVPAFIRGRTMPQLQPVGGTAEPWTVGYLIDTILTRDTWMHRVDIAHATGHDLTITAGHDGLLVADVVAEWADRHGQPAILCLTGPAGGTWEWGKAAPGIELDAVEFCRILSGRAAGDGLLRQEVPF
jgi:uncharacterized protein (TIGR03083 family)